MDEGKPVVNRCICHRRSFQQLKEYAEAEDIEEVGQLVEQRMCGCGCGICIPYVKRMLRTGKTVFKPSVIYRENQKV